MTWTFVFIKSGHKRSIKVIDFWSHIWEMVTTFFGNIIGCENSFYSHRLGIYFYLALNQLSRSCLSFG